MNGCKRRATCIHFSVSLSILETGLHPGRASENVPLLRPTHSPGVGRQPPSLVSQGNKGGVSIRLSLYGHSVCFLNCHLPAHLENAKQRLDDFEHILEMQHFEEKTFPSALDHE